MNTDGTGERTRTAEESVYVEGDFRGFEKCHEVWSFVEYFG